MLTLPAQFREIKGRKNNQLRKQMMIPAVVYGHGIKNQNIQVSSGAFSKIFKEIGETSLINLSIGEKKPIKALIRDIQHHPLTNRVEHIDFYEVRADEMISVEVPLKLIGEASIVKELGGIIVLALKEIKIQCLPENLIHEIEVNIATLKTFDASIRIKDLKVPIGLKLMNNPEDVVVAVEQPRVEEELKTLEEKPGEEIAKVEVITEKKTEEDSEQVKEEK
ncbi:MAG: 50S ribosomal protein L25 [Patescibacteria group bacterium]